MQYKNQNGMSATNEFQMVIFISLTDPLIDSVSHLRPTAAKRPSTKGDKIHMYRPT